MNDLCEKLDKMVPNPKCELNYKKDYELLIAVVLSAQCTDKRVNKQTEILFNKYNIFDLSKLNFEDIFDIIRPLGSGSKKSVYVIEIAKKIVNDYNGKVPNNREYLESLPGVGRKSCNVVLSELFDVPAIAVDTHVERVTKRLGLVSTSASVLEVEKKLMELFPKDKWSKMHLQLVLFGRYMCTAKNPKCSECLFTGCPSREEN